MHCEDLFLLLLPLLVSLLLLLLPQAAGTADDPYAFMPKPEDNNQVDVTTGLECLSSNCLGS